MASKGKAKLSRLGVVAAVVALLVVGASPASADVERHQATDYELIVDSVNGNSDFSHTYYIRYVSSDGSYTGTGFSDFHAGSESLSEFEASNGTLSFRADYEFNDYFWFPSFDLLDGGNLAFQDGYGPDNVTAATGTWTETTYKNHGQYVSESIADGGPDAHSLIGMPVQSKKKSK